MPGQIVIFAMVNWSFFIYVNM